MLRVDRKTGYVDPCFLPLDHCYFFSILSCCCPFFRLTTVAVINVVGKSIFMADADLSNYPAQGAQGNPYLDYLREIVEVLREIRDGNA